MLPITEKYTVTAVFGQTGEYWATAHKGIDFVSDNKKVVAAAAGTVRVVAYDSAGWGNYVTVGDADGYIHVYCHLKSVAVSAGQKVAMGQSIGVMGSTGNATGVHLHYQINDKNGAAINAAEFLGIKNQKGSFLAPAMFADHDSISDWAKESVYYVRQKGLMVGDQSGRFNPAAPLTREQAAVILHNIAKNKE